MLGWSNKKNDNLKCNLCDGFWYLIFFNLRHFCLGHSATKRLILNKEVRSSEGKKDRLLVDECLDKLKISYLRNRIFTPLSGREQQMVIVARALAQQPSFLIMDEPTSSLDFGNQIKIIRQVNDLKDESLGILMATHAPDHAFMCDVDVAVVHQNKIWKRGYCNDVITTDVLMEIYRTNISVCSVDDGNGFPHTVCIHGARLAPAPKVNEKWKHRLSEYKGKLACLCCIGAST